MTDFFVHETAIIDSGAHIGSGTKIWHWVHVCAGVRIGDDCNIGQNVFIADGVIIGKNCKIQNNVSVYQGVMIEDGVFCGPSMVFTNIYNPRAEIRKMDQVRPTLVKRGATLGANCTIVCGVTIGRYAFVGAGAVVNRSVPDHGLVVGNPGKRIGWVCRCGERLSDDLKCGVCGSRYVESESGIGVPLMKIATIIGARPQFVKAAPVGRAIRRAGHQEFLIHTGQHYDRNMSGTFFQQLEIPEPDLNLGIGSGSHGRQTGEMLIRLEAVLIAEKPDWVLVYGDTNSTLAGALAAVKLHIPIAHVEAGLRSFNRRMPEEHNRVLSDHVSDLLFCPTANAVENLNAERIVRGVHLVGDVMYDSVLHNAELAKKRSDILKRFGLKAGDYALATVHRAENTDDPERLGSIFKALGSIAREGLKVVAPLHPRTRKKLGASGLVLDDLDVCEPVSYLDMLMLEMNAKVIVTDSGGVQKEAYWFGVPCVTARDETEWVETVESGLNRVVGCDGDAIVGAVRDSVRPLTKTNAYGDGDASGVIAGQLQKEWQDKTSR